MKVHSGGRSALLLPMCPRAEKGPKRSLDSLQRAWGVVGLRCQESSGVYSSYLLNDVALRYFIAQGALCLSTN